MQTAFLTEEQRARFERDGFLVVPGALPEPMVERLLAAVDRLYEKGLREGRPQGDGSARLEPRKGDGRCASDARSAARGSAPTPEGLSDRGRWHLRNCIVADPVFLELLDWPATVPLVVDLLNWNIHLITSHLIVRAPSPPEADAFWKAEGWHRDGGTSATEMQEPHPRLFIKIAYWLTDLSETGRGGIRFIPGSHRLTGRPAQAEGAPDPYGAVEITARPGDAVLFEQRMWHAVGPNTSSLTRKSLFFGYGYRWLRPMDYVTMPQALLSRCTPIQRQLLGDAKTQLGYYLPTDEDVPLRAWWRERQEQRAAGP